MEDRKVDSQSMGRIVAEGLGILVVLLLAGGGAILPLLSNAAEWTGNLSSPWLWSGLAMLPLLVMHGKVDEWFTRHRGAGGVLVCVVCACATGVALSDDLNARLGAADDHEIVENLGPGHQRAKWDHWWKSVAHSEAGTWGAVGRFRPAFYATRFAECCLWGKEAWQWYGAHLVMCTAMLALLWLTVQRWWGASLSFAFMLFVLGLPAVGDIYARLAASEAYALPAFFLGLWAWVRACAKGPSAVGLWWLGVLGLGLAELSKENFAPLAGLAVMVAAVMLWQSPATKKAGAWLAVGTLTVITGGMTVIIVRMVLAAGGKDFYGNEIQSIGILKIVGHASVRLFLALCPFLAWGLMVARSAERKPWWSSRGRLRNAALLMAAMFIAWISQAVFYRNTEWPEGTRYDFPGILIAYAAMIAGGCGLLSLVREKGWQAVAKAGMLLTLLIAAGDGVVHHTMAQASLNSSRTKRFSTWISTIANVARAHPETALILVPENASLHYEPAIAVCRFLRYKKISNPILMSTQVVDKAALNSPVETNTAQIMHHDLAGRAYGLEQVDDAKWPENAVVVPFSEREAQQLEGSSHPSVPGSYDRTK